jgi:ferredoxin
MRVQIDRELCQTHGVCVEETPEVFAIVDRELVLLIERPSEALRDKLREAVRYCPTGALRVFEE